MSQRIVIVQQYVTGYFGKAEQREYDGVLFDNDKVAFVDDENNVIAYENEEEMLEELCKHGSVVIRRLDEEC